MRDTKVVVIGAASASFGPGVLLDAVHCAALRGSTLVLVDLNAERLDVITRLAQRLNDETGAGLVIESTTERCQALPGAEFVITAIAVKRNELWRLDYRFRSNTASSKSWEKMAGRAGCSIPCAMCR